MPKFTLSLKIFFIIAAALFFWSCAKRRAFNDESAQTPVEIRQFQLEQDVVMTEANTLLADQFLMRGKQSGGFAKTLCGCDADTGSVFSGTVSLVYNNSVCNNRRRTGKIQITILNYPLAKWKKVGSTVKMEFDNYAVTYVDGTTYTLSGTQYVINESGGTWYDLYYTGQASLSQRIEADNVRVRYDPLHSAFISTSRRVVYTLKSGVVYANMSAAGDYNGESADTWGTDRDGAPFHAGVTTTMQWNSACGAMKPATGASYVVVDGKEYTFTCTYGVNDEGNTGDWSASHCATAWRVDWTYRNSSARRVFGY
jgi:hypothetical protein